MTSPEALVEADAAIRRTWATIADNQRPDIADDLVIRHSEPLRRYHNTMHVMWVLRHVEWLLVRCAVATDGDAIRAAALFHDAIYEPLSATNERDSAALATEALRRIGWTQRRINAVAEMIVATAGHLADDGHIVGPDAATAVLLDADLAILGSTPEDYDRYVAGVRAEYREVDEPAWNVGRAAVLRNFLAREQIFSTNAMREARGVRARDNITAELAALVSLA